MSKTFGVIPLEDIYPLADEYGNEYAQRDYSLKVNQDYVAELAESMRMAGEPDEPITVIPEGGIYYVKVGRSRYEAMRLLGTRECHAVIDDDTSRQAAIEAIVRTDVKKKYEDLEKSRMVQQLQMFGDDQYVSEVAGITVEQSRKVRRARRAVDDAGEDMTLDRMYLIAEFADDPEAVEELSGCKESEVAWKASRLRSRREAERALAEYRDAFAAIGVPVAEERGEAGGMCYYVNVREPGDAAACMPPEWGEGQVLAVLASGYSGVRAEIYVDPDIVGGDEEESEARRLEDAYCEAIEAMDEARHAWFWGNVAEGKPMPNLLREAGRYFGRQWFVKEAIDAMPDDAKAAAKNKGPSIYDYALGYSGIHHSGAPLARALAKGEIEDYRRGQVNGYIDELALYQADGWDPGNASALVAKLSGLADGNDGESEASDD